MKLGVRRTIEQPIRAYSRELVAEAIGTFTLVFAGTGAVMVNRLSDGAITHLGISFVFGAVVAALIYSLGHISGAHFNPAVTLAFWSSGFLRKDKVIPYILSQVLGAIAASTVLALSLGYVANLGATLPRDGNWQQSFILETVLTFILMLVIFGSGLDRRAPLGFAGIAIGLTVGLEAAFMGLMTGASMNPARSFGPAFVGWTWQHQWLYWVAPILGAQLAVWVYRYLSNGFSDLKR
ncbi:MIP/aquaporin family protein [Myxacorys almedinensis]|uniref:MIP family channel protein n=1 Tax=Myxacorys almedinensis A TaxID=2690445 RepID=A0A8J8CIH9_9CYAN|nr:MIP/aquaporin family protein [Myxacorys almedinensis]NDJ17838.1 MIP family channel protein [Myxacorys almedinensis A]